MSRDLLSALEDAIGALCELKSKEPSVAFLKIYRKALLEKLTIQEAISAVEMAFVRKTFGFPSPGDLIEWMKGSAEDTALIAWGSVLEAFGRVGANGTVVFADTKITRTIELLGGWIKICLLEGEACDWFRREFIKIYGSLQTTNEAPRPLFGLHELNNRSRGFLEFIPKPITIGDFSRPARIESSREEITEAINRILPGMSMDPEEDRPN